MNKECPNVIFIINSEGLSTKVQDFLFSLGYIWRTGKAEYIYFGSSDVLECICLREQLSHCPLSYFKNQKEFNNYKYFDAATEWDKIEDFFEINIKKVDVYFKGIKYKINKT